MRDFGVQGSRAVAHSMRAPLVDAQKQHRKDDEQSDTYAQSLRERRYLPGRLWVYVGNRFQDIAPTRRAPA